MVNFTANELNGVTRIGSLARECVSEDSFGEIVTAELLTLLNSVSGVFIEFEADDSGVGLSSGRSYIADPGHMRSYIDYYQYLDPVLRDYRNNFSDPFAISTTDRVVESERSYVSTEFYRDFIAKTGIHQAMIFGLSAQSMPFGLIGLHRLRSQDPYSDKDLAMVRLVIPYLGMALRFRQRERASAREAEVLKRLLEASQISGYLVLDESFTLQSFAGDASALLRAHNLSTLDELGGVDVFRLLRSELARELVELKRGNANSGPCRSIRKVDFPAKKLWQVDTIRHDDGSRQFLCVALSPSHAGLSAVRLQNFNLTPRQVDVAKLVALGMTNHAIAGAIGISAKTVENYLSVIYSKTGAVNKASLVALLVD